MSDRKLENSQAEELDPSGSNSEPGSNSEIGLAFESVVDSELASASAAVEETQIAEAQSNSQTQAESEEKSDSESESRSAEETKSEVIKNAIEVIKTDNETKRVGLEPVRTIIAGLFAIIYAYDVWEAIDSTIKLSSVAALGSWHWVVLVSMIVAPVIVWILAVWVGWKQKRWALALILFAGLAISAMIFVNLNYFFWRV